MSEKSTNSIFSDSVHTLLDGKTVTSDFKTNSLLPEDSMTLLHELQVHQIELETQNEELRRSREKLEIYTNKYFDLYNLAPVGYLTINEKDGILETNLRAATMIGTTRASMIMKPFYSYVLPEYRDIYHIHHNKLVETGLPQICELEIMKKGGGSFWARLESSLSNDTESSSCKIVIIDINENRQHQDEIDTQNNILSIIFEKSPYIMILVDDQNRVVNINKKGVVFSGREKKSLLGQIGGAAVNCINSFSEPGCGKKPECAVCPILNSVEKTFQTGEPNNDIEGKMKFVSGNSGFELDLLISTSLIRYKSSGLVLVTIIDITERKEIEKAQLFLSQCGYQSSDENFFELLARYLSQSLGMEYVCIDRLLGDNLTAMTVAVYNNGVFENNVEYTLKDTPCGEVVGKTICCFQKGVRQLFLNDMILQEMKAESYVGTTLWGFDGKPIGLIAVIGLKPLTNPHIAESILKMVGIRAAGELERKRANEAFLKIEKQFVQAQKMEAIGRLAGGVAHDFNNMLSVILGYSDLILDNQTPGNEFYDNIIEIYKAAERSKDLTQQLLAFSRQQAITLKPVDLGLLAFDIEKVLKRLIGEDINLVLKIEEKLWMIYSDVSQMTQVLMNLAVNAKDAMPDGGTLYIELSNIDDDPDLIILNPAAEKDRYVLVSVSDTGHGIDKEILPNIFEPFFTTKGPGQGTGLGLSTIYGIVRQNLGYIHVSSDPKLGTTFRIFMPALPDKTEIKTTENKKSTEIAVAGGLILLVEDDDLLIKMTKVMLGKAGYKVIAFQSPEEALVFCHESRKKIDLLLTDVVMPVMTGKDLSRKLKKAMPDLKVIYMSGYTSEIITSKGILDDGINFIQKPFTSIDLVNKIRMVLR